MVTLKSKIPGMQIWAYDVSRRPDKTPDEKGNPQLLKYTKQDEQYSGVSPVTQNPTEYLDKPINSFRYICDVNHISTGSGLLTHGIIFNQDDNIEQRIGTQNYYSNGRYANAIFKGDDIYVTADNPNSATQAANKRPFTTTSQGINIIYQTGVVGSNRGYSVVIFELTEGYKIPVGTIIKATPTIQNDFGGTVNGTPQTFEVLYDILPGVYEIITKSDPVDDWYHCDIDFATVSDTPELPTSKVTFDLTHCTVSPNETTVNNGINSWTFTAENGYIFDTNGGIVKPNTSETGNEIPATNTNVTHLNDYNVQSDITIKLTANLQQDPTIPFVQKLEHVKSNVTSALISRTLNAINLTADDGYTFQSSIQVLFYSGGKVILDYNVDGNHADTITIPLNTSEKNTITSNMDNIQLTASATLETSHVGYEHNYLITEPELNSFSKDQIWNYVGGSDIEEQYNVSQFINNLIELPFKVDTITNVNQISVGRVKSNVVSHEAKSRFVTLDLGTINVPAKYHNGYDYQNKTVKLYTPFVSPITINNENAIEKTIHIIYKIDISNGNLTINLYNEHVLFFTGTDNIASQLPFLNTLKNTIINRDTHFNDNDIRQPYIIVSRETPILNNDYYPTIERGLIKNYNGNVKVSLLNNMNIPNNELTELTSQLESGVKYVKSN